uniref:DAC domain-containing protein n=1 Tax=Chromera velia CCMP2878 TaxID=1169474 RepID=A0A0G4FND4_9ALVE|eukprot:Cvel_17946.t1-p1 / transcript=Cvel_17946.t1 / gene=Cvel_17946 / organism=Chromera_velia_CCMP2878 / gene_product=hypothetical protein / transcript_product=hypothetical protein / location=Cvel_scaffold1459:13212-16270(-) / protein_length=874 / sequence_SO=supercontig / SO=protein_coding / is_pseudo=false
MVDAGARLSIRMAEIVEGRSSSGSADGFMVHLKTIFAAASEMSTTKTGCSIVLVRSDADLVKPWLEAGRPLSIEVSVDALVRLFDKESPLHDGVLFIVNGRLHAKVPLPCIPGQDPGSHGLRHLSMRQTTASYPGLVAILVSEQDGGIRLVKEGKFFEVTSQQDVGILMSHSGDADAVNSDGGAERGMELESEEQSDSASTVSEGLSAKTSSIDLDSNSSSTPNDSSSDSSDGSSAVASAAPPSDSVLQGIRNLDIDQIRELFVARRRDDERPAQLHKRVLKWGIQRDSLDFEDVARLLYGEGREGRSSFEGELSKQLGEALSMDSSLLVASVNTRALELDSNIAEQFALDRWGFFGTIRLGRIMESFDPVTMLRLIGLMCDFLSQIPPDFVRLCSGFPLSTLGDAMLIYTSALVAKERGSGTDFSILDSAVSLFRWEGPGGVFQLSPHGQGNSAPHPQIVELVKRLEVSRRLLGVFLLRAEKTAEELGVVGARAVARPELIRSVTCRPKLEGVRLFPGPGPWLVGEPRRLAGLWVLEVDGQSTTGYVPGLGSPFASLLTSADPVPLRVLYYPLESQSTFRRLLQPACSCGQPMQPFADLVDWKCHICEGKRGGHAGPWASGWQCVSLVCPAKDSGLPPRVCRRCAQGHAHRLKAKAVEVACEVGSLLPEKIWPRPCNVTTYVFLGLGIFACVCVRTKVSSPTQQQTACGHFLASLQQGLHLFGRLLTRAGAAVRVDVAKLAHQHPMLFALACGRVLEELRCGWMAGLRGIPEVQKQIRDTKLPKRTEDKVSKWLGSVGWPLLSPFFWDLLPSLVAFSVFSTIAARRTLAAGLYGWAFRSFVSVSKNFLLLPCQMTSSVLAGVLYKAVRLRNLE